MEREYRDCLIFVAEVPRGFTFVVNGPRGRLVCPDAPYGTASGALAAAMRRIDEAEEAAPA